jgi:hypothetical protein
LHKWKILEVEIIPRTFGKLKLYVVSVPAPISVVEIMSVMAQRMRVGDRMILNGHSFERADKRKTGFNYK